jgi:hypothetical protein
MTDQELKDLVASLAVAQAKTDKQLRETDRYLTKRFKETDKQLKETDRKLKSVGIQLGNMSKNQGDIAEEYFVNSLKDSLKIADLNFDMLLKNVGLQTKKINDEFDILLVNGESVAIIEVKYKVHPKDLEKLPSKIEHFKIQPQYKKYKIYAGIAGFYVPNDVIESAKKMGYFVLQRKGDIIQSYTDNLKAA